MDTTQAARENLHQARKVSLAELRTARDAGGNWGDFESVACTLERYSWRNPPIVEIEVTHIIANNRADARMYAYTYGQLGLENPLRSAGLAR